MTDQTTFAELDDVLTPQEVAALLKVSVKWVYDHTSRAEPRIPCAKLSGHLRFSKRSVSAWFREQMKG